MRWLHGALLALCALGLAALVAASGPRELWHEGRQLGWTVPLIIALFGVEHGVRALAWWSCYRPEARPPLGRLFWVRLASYAINTATPSATVVGEVARAGLMTRAVARLETVTAISVDRLADSLADCLIGLCGLVVVLTHAPFPLAARMGLLAAAILLAIGVGAFFLLQRRGKLAALFTERPFVRRLAGRTLMTRVANGGRALDERLRSFHADRPAAFARALGLHVIGTSVAAAQIGCFLYGMGEPVAVLVVLEIFVVGVALDLFSFFVPARLGAQEGARMVAVALAGFPARFGLLYSLVLRVEQVSWALVGFLAYLRLAGATDDAAMIVPPTAASDSQS